MDVLVETYLDCDDAWLKALTRQRRAEAKARRLAALPPTVRYSGDSYEFHGKIGAAEKIARRTAAYQTWKKREWKGLRRRCEYCHVQMTLRKNQLHSFTLDHGVPLARGGADECFNWKRACYACNQLKKEMTVEEFMAFLQEQVVAALYAEAA